MHTYKENIILINDFYTIINICPTLHFWYLNKTIQKRFGPLNLSGLENIYKKNYMLHEIKPLEQNMQVEQSIRITPVKNNNYNTNKTIQKVQ
jgi:hypothetical protein